MPVNCGSFNNLFSLFPSLIFSITPRPPPTIYVGYGRVSRRVYSYAQKEHLKGVIGQQTPQTVRRINYLACSAHNLCGNNHSKLKVSGVFGRVVMWFVCLLFVIIVRATPALNQELRISVNVPPFLLPNVSLDSVQIVIRSQIINGHQATALAVSF